MLSELTNPSEFFIQRKQAGWLEAIEIWFNEDVHKEYLAKLDTGNGTTASTVEVGKYEEKNGSVTFDVDGKKVTTKVINTAKAKVGDSEFERKVIQVPLVRIGLRQMSNVQLAVIEKRDKSTNVLVNRDLLSKLGYVVVSDETHILTPEIEKVNIV